MLPAASTVGLLVLGAADTHGLRRGSACGDLAQKLPCARVRDGSVQHGGVWGGGSRPSHLLGTAVAAPSPRRQINMRTRRFDNASAVHDSLVEIRL